MKKPIIITTSTILLLAIVLGLYLLNSCQKNVEPIDNFEVLNISVTDATTNDLISDYQIFSQQTLDYSINSGQIIFETYPDETSELVITADNYIANNTVIDVIKNSDCTGYVTSEIKLQKKTDNVSYIKKTLNEDSLTISTLNEEMEVIFPLNILNKYDTFEAYNSYGINYPDTYFQYPDYLCISNFYVGPENISFMENQEPTIKYKVDVDEQLLNIVEFIFFRLNIEDATWQQISTLYTINGNNVIFKINQTGYYSLLIDPTNIFSFTLEQADSLIEEKSINSHQNNFSFSFNFQFNEISPPEQLSSIQAIKILKSNICQENKCEEGINNYNLFLVSTDLSINQKSEKCFSEGDGNGIKLNKSGSCRFKSWQWDNKGYVGFEFSFGIKSSMAQGYFNYTSQSASVSPCDPEHFGGLAN